MLYIYRMELIVLLAALSLLQSCKTQGSSGVTSMFVLKGGDVILKITKSLEKDDAVIWKIDTRSIVLVRFFPGREPEVNADYSGRIELLGNFTVKVKNLQEADSGVYFAAVIGSSTDQKTSEYNIIVQDLVSPVELKVDSISRSSDSCDFTVACSTQDSHINCSFRCSNQTCSQEGEEQSEIKTSGSSLKVSLSNGSVICNHSNQVSKKEDVKIIEQICTAQTNPEQHNPATLPAIVISVFIVIIIVIVIVYLRKKAQNKKENVENTIYEVPLTVTTIQPQHQSPGDDLSPTSTYCLVGPHAGHIGSTETRSTTLPESLYAQVERPAKSSKT